MALEQDLAALRASCDRHMRDIENYYLRRIEEIEVLNRGRQHKIEELQDILKLRDAAVASLMTSLKECHHAIDRIQKDKMTLIKEKEELQKRVHELERRPEPLPCGLPELTRAALDQVRKWDADHRLDVQKQELWSMRKDMKYTNKEFAAVHEKLRDARKGHSLKMRNIWKAVFENYGHEEEAPRRFFNSNRDLHNFLWSLVDEEGNEFLAQNHQDYLDANDGESEASAESSSNED